MELTFEKAMELFEITDISKIKTEDVAQIEKKAKKRWHPDKVIHLNDPAITQEYTLNFQQIELAGEMILSYLNGTYQAGNAYHETNNKTYQEPEEVIRQNAPELQTKLKDLWDLIKGEKYKWHEEEVVISEGYKLKDRLIIDFKEDLAILSIISFFYGAFSLGILMVIAGFINPFLSSLVGIVWAIQALSCVLGFLPLSRFWLPEPIQNIMFKFINFGLGVFNWAELKGRTSNGPWILLLVSIPVLLAKLIKYVILFPLFEIAKAIINDKLYGVVKGRVNYYAGASEWYIEELLNKIPNEMSSEELFHLSAIYSELSDVASYYTNESSNYSEENNSKKYSSGHSKNSYHDEVRQAFINSCIENGGDKEFCMCVFKKIQNKYSIEEFAAIDEQMRNQQTPEDFLDFVSKARLECSKLNYTSKNNEHNYPEKIKNDFIKSCIQNGGDDKYCNCVLIKIQEKYTLEEFSAIEVKMNLNQTPEDFINFMNSIGGECIKNEVGKKNPPATDFSKSKETKSNSYTHGNIKSTSTFTWKFLIVGVIFFIIAACVFLYFSRYKTFDSSNNTNNIQPASIANSNINIQTQSGALSYIRKFEGKDPINSKLFETSPLKERLIQLLGDKYKTFIDNMGVTTPIKIINDTLFASGCLPDKCGSDEAAISILFNSDKILVGIINDDNHTFYSEKPFPDQLPQELKSWFDYRINAIQNKLEKLHKYNFTGTVVSVEEQGNRGMTYLSIKTVDGKDESFLINAAKIYKDDNEVNSNQLVKGINVGIIGGDEAKRIDILVNTSTTDSKVQGKYPQASERLISQSEFNGMSKADMKIMRNEIFARHGYIFKTEDMNSYFSKQSWYKGEYEDVTSMLSNIEKQNVELIKRFEN